MAKNSHLGGILAHVFAYFTWIIGPIVILVTAEDEFSKNNARSALNWQLSAAIYGLVSLVLVFILIGIVLLIALGIINTIFIIIASIKASEGKVWHYPGAITFLKQQ